MRVTDKSKAEFPVFSDTERLTTRYGAHHKRGLDNVLKKLSADTEEVAIGILKEVPPSSIDRTEDRIFVPTDSGEAPPSPAVRRLASKLSEELNSVSEARLTHARNLPGVEPSRVSAPAA